MKSECLSEKKHFEEMQMMKNHSKHKCGRHVQPPGAQPTESSENTTVPDMLSTELGVPLVSNDEELEVNEPVDPEEEERMSHHCCFRLRIHDSGSGRHVSNLDMSRQQVWSDSCDVM